MKRIPALAICLFTACTGSGDDRRTTSEAYRAEIAAWQSERLSRLQEPWGWLNLAGLHWLDEGEHSVGSGADNDIVLPGRAAGLVGIVTLTADAARFRAAPGVAVMSNDSPVTEMTLVPDTGEQPSRIVHRNIGLAVIERDGALAFRVWDFEHPGAKRFTGIPVYETDAAYRVVAQFEPYDVPRSLTIGTVIDWLAFEPVSPGLLRFSVREKEQTLEVYQSDGAFFVVFADATSAAATYPAGRFVYTDLPDESGATVIDFNKAYNPPCAFNEFATCPVAASRNRLAVPIEAGERYTSELHTD